MKGLHRSVASYFMIKSSVRSADDPGSSTVPSLRLRELRRKNRWRLAPPKRERYGLLYAQEPVRHRRGDTIRTTPALLPLPLQHLGQRLATEVPLILVRKLADGEVRLLLAGTWSTEGHTQNLHLCAAGTRNLRLTAYLARSRLRRRLGQGNLQSASL